jgi:hypothetical protein
MLNHCEGTKPLKETMLDHNVKVVTMRDKM